MDKNKEAMNIQGLTLHAFSIILKQNKMCTDGHKDNLKICGFKMYTKMRIDPRRILSFQKTFLSIVHDFFMTSLYIPSAISWMQL